MVPVPASLADLNECKHPNTYLIRIPDGVVVTSLQTGRETTKDFLNFRCPDCRTFGWTPTTWLIRGEAW